MLLLLFSPETYFHWEGAQRIDFSRSAVIEYQWPEKLLFRGATHGTVIYAL